MTAACINIHVNDGNPVLLAIDTDFNDIITEYPSMTTEQLSVLTFLSSVFYIHNNPYWSMNLPLIFLKDNFYLNIGELVDSTVDPSHPVDSLTLFTYTEDTLKNSFKNKSPFGYQGTLEEWKSLVDNTSFDNLPELMSTYMPGTCYIEKTPLKISFSSATAEEVEAYLASIDDTTSVFEDAYPWLKSFVGNEAQGYSRPNSTPVSTTTLNDREVISFETQVHLSVDDQTTGNEIM